jgi:N6-adenosine-specific RNA methylase IME4
MKIRVQKAFASGKEKFQVVECRQPFATAIIDPDWPYTVAPGMKTLIDPGREKGRLSGFTRNRDVRQNQYKRDVPMSIAELKALPIGDVVGGYVFLWTVGPFLINGDAAAVLNAWGFEPVSILTWAKYDLKAGHGYGGVGYWFLGNAEFCMVGKREGWPSIRTGKSSLFIERKRGHSSKPGNVHELCEARFPGPWLEVFGRYEAGLFGPRENWTVIGDEIDGQDVRDAIRKWTGDDAGVDRAVAGKR